MATELSKEEVVDALRGFKARRDNLLHEDEAAFTHHLERFVEACRTNPLVRTVLAPLEAKFNLDVDAWIQAVCEHEAKLGFPTDPDQELVLRYRVIERAAKDENLNDSLTEDELLIRVC